MPDNLRGAFRSLMIFTASRYFTNLLQVLRGLIIARYLGPYYFGIWGFLTISLQYLSYTNVNVENGVTVLLSLGDNKGEKATGEVASSAIISSALIGLAVLAGGVLLQITQVDLFPKFTFNNYILLVLGITVLSNIQRVLTNVHRVKKALNKIIFVEVITAFLLLGSAIIFKDEKLINAQLVCMLLTNCLAIFIYSIKHPFTLVWKPNLSAYKKLFSISFPLFIYNLSFYLIPLSARTILSIFYSVAQLGYYTLAYSISNAILLGFRSIAWAIYPEVLTKLQDGLDIKEVKTNIEKINRIYSTSVNFALYALILILPLLLEFVPQYKSALPSIVILLLSQGVLTTSFGYNSLAVSRNAQGQVAKISMITVVFVVIASLGVSLFKLDYTYIAISVLLGSILYTVWQSRVGLRLLGINENWLSEYIKSMPIGGLLAFGVFLASAFFARPYFWTIPGMLIFLILDRHYIKELFIFVTQRKGYG